MTPDSVSINATPTDTTPTKTPRRRSERIVSQSPQMDMGALPPMPVTPRSSLRSLLDDYLRWSAGKRNVSIQMTFDASEFTRFAARCKREGKRPPSLVAYVLRCAGVVFDKHRELMAAKYKKGLFVPEDVNIALMVSAHLKDGGSFPLMVGLTGVQSKTLPQISEELAQTSRGIRRQALAQSPKFREALKLAAIRPGVRRVLLALCSLFPKYRAAVAFHASHVGVSSLTQHLRSRGGWCATLMPYTFNLILGGLSKRAIVVNDEVVARECLDMTFMIDHEILDGGPGLDFVDDFAKEFESGRLLSEF